MRWRPTSFRSELLLVFLGLFLIVQTASFFYTRTVSERNARAQVAESLAVAGGALSRLLADRDQHLLESGRVLAGDFAFKSTFATHDAGTIVSMLENHRHRIGADAMMLVSLDDEIIADTLHPEATGKPFGHPWLIEQALKDDNGEATGILLVDGKPLQFIIFPLMTPLHEAWIAVGFRLDDAFVASLKSFSMADLSIIGNQEGHYQLHASTLPITSRDDLIKAMPRTPNNQAFEMFSKNGRQLSLALPLVAEQEPIYALMQRPLDQVLAPYRKLQALLALLFTIGLAATALGATLLARGVAKPLTELALGARRIANGDYQQRMSLSRNDEIGVLAQAFNEMAIGLADRDRVRSLLGKVVSPQIAEELLSRDIALGGEECEATILFADCRGFTSISENMAPTEVLGRLNELLTVVTEVIERHGGVVDKYIGDAVMALFGAPLAHNDDPRRAVACALDMIDAVKTLNTGRVEGDRLELAIGVNTGDVVAGNMGSTSRLNYTVIGDAVNLASRIESQTRHYGVDILVSEYTRAAALDHFNWREVDRVQVKGRQALVAVYEPSRRIVE